MRLGIIADTHGLLRPEVFETFREVDHILHAGDVGPEELLIELEAIAPVTAVWGNTDGFDVRRKVPEVVQTVLDGFRVVVVHGHQFGVPTPDRLKQAYPDAEIIVFGHTHKPLLTVVDLVVTVMNPGGAGRRRFDLPASVGIMELEPGIPPRARLVPLTVLKRIDGELPPLFKTLPRLPYGIREIPAFAAPGNTTAYYFPGTGEGTKAGFYYVNTYDLKSRPFYEIEALSLHEAVPGHHLQIALQQELDLPNFRRFNGFTAFVEGWALYSERLGLEMGFYPDPYSDFGRLSYEMWRACRLVVDTGMHALGWNRQHSIDFMSENTSSTLMNITNDIDRYIGWPGQALAYKIAELKIRELRERAEKKLGVRFDLREFHDLILLLGAVPLDILDSRVESWINQANG